MLTTDDREMVLEARKAIVDRLGELGRLSPEREPRISAFMKGRSGVGLYDDPLLQKNPIVKKALENERIRDFFELFFEEPAQTYSYKWLRAVGGEEFTGRHRT